MSNQAAKRTTLRLTSPTDVIAAVPVLLGFHPTDSLVMLVAAGPVQFHARTDLPDPDRHQEAIRSLLAPALKHEVAAVVFVAYSQDRMSPAVLDQVREAFTQAGVRVAETIHVNEAGYLCPGRGGDRVPVDTQDHPITLGAMFRDTPVVPDRAALAAMVAPDPDALDPGAVRIALRQSPGWVVDLLTSGDPLEDVDVAALVASLEDPQVRDAVCQLAASVETRDVLAQLCMVARRTPDPVAPHVAALTAFAAWQAGDGALAWCALDRAEQSSRPTRLGDLVRLCLDGAVPPSLYQQVLDQTDETGGGSL